MCPSCSNVFSNASTASWKTAPRITAPLTQSTAPKKSNTRKRGQGVPACPASVVDTAAKPGMYFASISEGAPHFS